MRMIKSVVLLAAGFIASFGAASLLAQGAKPFRIGTGPSAGTYHAIGSIIAGTVSDSSGVTVTPVSSTGSVANVEAVAAGRSESALIQADVTYWAFTATEMFDGRPPAQDLRTIANLYQESIHLVVRKEAGIQTVADLRGKRVSLDEQGSGTLADAKLVLAGWGLKESDVSAEYLPLAAAIQKIKAGTLDAFFHVGGYPVAPIVDLANSETPIDLAPIDGPNAEKLRGEYKFFAREEIPTGTYKGLSAARTLSVAAQWVTSTKVDAGAVYAATKGLWSEKTRQALEAGHPKGKIISRDNALHGIGIPLHPGAERFYREAGLIN